MLGIKLTGDTNVPAGNVSFRAKISRKHRHSGFDLMYPPELEIVARYAGEGRVAHKGFTDARYSTLPSSRKSCCLPTDRVPFMQGTLK